MTDFMDNWTYNLSKVINPDIIDSPENWFAEFNSLLGGYVTITFLLVLGVVLFLIARQLENVSDSEAMLYSGLAISIIGTLLFVIDVTGIAKIVSFPQLLIVWTITGVAIIINNANRKY